MMRPKGAPRMALLPAPGGRTCLSIGLALSAVPARKTLRWWRSKPDVPDASRQAIRPRPELRVLPGGARAGWSIAASSRRDVIVVDDDPVSLQLFESLLARLDPKAIAVHCFADPRLALSFAIHHPVALALVDMHFGQGAMTGLDLIERMRRGAPNGEQMAVILVTADPEPMVVYEATRRAVPVVLQKAVNLHRLLLRCCALLEISPPE